MKNKGKEIWKNILYFYGYMVSNLGRVKCLGKIRPSTRGNIRGKRKVLSQFDNGGKLAVHLYSDFGKRNDRNVDFLVAQAFVKNPKNKSLVVHKDGDVRNNVSCNLEWSCVSQRTYNKHGNLINAVNEYISGKDSLDSISKKYNISDNALKNIVKKNGYEIRGKADVRKLSGKEISFLVNEYISGKHIYEIAEKLGKSKAVIIKYLHLNNCAIKQKRKGRLLDISDEMKQRAKDLYVKEEMSATKISKIFGVSPATILSWIGDVKRNQSETISLLHLKGNYDHKGNRCKFINTKFGKIRVDSNYELDRIRQLESNNEIRQVSRCLFLIPYIHDKTRRYNPDFFIEYENGKKVIEEIKPEYKLTDEINIKKFNAATEYCKSNGFFFNVVTEKIIYGR